MTRIVLSVAAALLVAAGSARAADTPAQEQNKKTVVEFYANGMF